MLAACSTASSGDPPAPTDGLPDASAAPVVMAVRVVCRVAGDIPAAAAAGINGLDGTESVVAGGTQYWFFGDTVREGAQRQDVIPAAVATTADTDASDCLDLSFKTAAAGAEPMFPRGDETTAWPDGALALDDGSVLFYIVKAYRTSPFYWYVGSIGLGRIPPGSLEGERVVETIWDERSGLGGRLAGVRSPVRAGDDVVVYIRMEDGRKLAAKAPLARIAEPAAYQYFDGSGWTPDPAKAAPIWTTPATGFPSDNGVHVTYDEQRGQWIALYNEEMSFVSIRTAPEPWGPWSERVRWFDCRPLVLDRYPYCYTAQFHPQLTRDPATIYMTVASSLPYDVTLLELHMAAPVHEWRDAGGGLRYAFASPSGGYEDRGVAFYASAQPAPGLSPVYERGSGSTWGYSLDTTGGGEPVFYAYSRLAEGAVALQPVSRVTRDGAPALATGADGQPAFYVPCATDSRTDSCSR